MGVEKNDFFPIWMPEIGNITERIVRKKIQYPGIPAGVLKTDIRNAPKRTPLHPDYVAISRHQFAAHLSVLTQDV